MTPKRPILRYHGGKWRLAPWIVQNMPTCQTYVEPYAGAASVLLRRPRAKVEIINDLSSDIVTLFRVLRSCDDSAALANLCRYTPYSREEWEMAWEHSDCDIERCRRLLIRSWMSHGVGGNTTLRGYTGFRRCARDGGSHPSRDWVSWADQIASIHDRLRGVVIEHRPATEVMKTYDSPETLHYVDPPYVISKRSRPDHGYEYEMSDDDHRDLAAVLQSLKGTVVLSGYKCELYQDLYGSWRRIDRDTRKDGGGIATESIWINKQSNRRLF